MRLVSPAVRQPDRIVFDFIGILLPLSDITAHFPLHPLNGTGAVIRIPDRLQQKVASAISALPGEIVILQALEQFDVQKTANRSEVVLLAQD